MKRLNSRRLSLLLGFMLLATHYVHSTPPSAGKIYTRGMTVNPSETAPLTRINSPGQILVQLPGPVNKANKQRLEKEGYKLLAYIPTNTFLAWASPNSTQPEELIQRGIATWVGSVKPQMKYSESALEKLSRLPEATIDIHLLPWANPMLVKENLLRDVAGGKVLEVSNRKHRKLLRLKIAGEKVMSIAAKAASMNDVIAVVERPEPELVNDHSIWVIQSYNTTIGPQEASASSPAQYPNSATIWHKGPLMGKGQIVAVMDSGMSETCYFEYESGAFPDYQQLEPPNTGTVDTTKKVMAYYVEPGAAAGDHGPYYHGSHVAGSVAGDNFAHICSESEDTPNHDSGDGMAPCAQLIMQDVGSSSGLTGLVGDLTDMLEQAYLAGARIHTNSWGAPTPTYTTDSQDMDEMSWRREDIVFTVAMGNSGTAPADSSIGAPATAKNVISVGGVTNGSSSSRADEMTTYSRGPTADGRLKPDVLTPAYSVHSADGSQSCGVATLSGTSMATPTAAGAVAMLREYFERGFWVTGSENSSFSLAPSAALMKAALINGAQPLGTVSGYDPLASGSVSPIPSNDQGWGRVNLDRSLWFSGDAEKSYYWDVRHRDGLETGQEWEVTVPVSTNTDELAVTLTWSDPPSSGMASQNLVNDLDLEVISPSGTTYLGNNFSNGWSQPGGTPDRLNNVEGVRIESPEAGSWTIKVIGYNVPGTPLALNSDRQGFAVAARTGACSPSQLSTPSNLSATDSPPDGVSLSWDAVPGAVRYHVLKAQGDCSSPASAFTYAAQVSGTSFMDSKAVGGYTYAYKVVADDGCGWSQPSSCVSVTYTGPCRLRPSFQGLSSATNEGSLASCEVRLEWEAGQSNCPLAPDLRYNIYRSEEPDFTPDPSNLLATTQDLSYVDQSVSSGVPYYYVVRAEDTTTGGSGPSGGNEEENSVKLKAVSWWGEDNTATSFQDDGGDTTAWLELEDPWTVSVQQNHTTGGRACYHSAKEGENYPASTCASATTPPIELLAGQTHTLSFWCRYNIEKDWDGVVVELSDDGGNTWTVLTPDQGYPGSFSQTGDPPINSCGYPASQEAFSGPTDNNQLTDWQQYTVDLSAWDGQTVQIRWRLSTDPGAEFEGFYLDDISITGARGPGRCGRSDGLVSFGSSSYSCNASVQVSVEDADLVGSGSLDVTVTTSSGDQENMTLIEDSQSPGRFEGTIPASPGSVTTGNGQLDVSDGDQIVAHYIDADDGHGNTNVEKTASANVDCTAPTISGVQVVSVTATSVTVAWQTDEPADSSATVQPGGATAQSDELVTSHQLTVEGLEPCHGYRVTVSSQDAAGNRAWSDPSDPFITYYLDQVMADDVESGPGSWTVDTAQDPGPGANWSIVETSNAHSPTHAWFSEDESGVKDDRLMVGPLLLGPGESRLEFWHRFDLEKGTSSAYDGGVVEVSTDGSNFQDVLDVGASFLEGGYTDTISSSYSNPLSGRQAWSGDSGDLVRTVVDLTPLSGQSLWIRFRLGCDSSVSDNGWWIDDITVTTTGPCTCSAPTFSGIESASAVSGQPAADLAWSAATDGCHTDYMEYLIFVGVGGSSVDWSTPRASTEGLSLRFLGLKPGTQYVFGVRAKDGVGQTDGNTVESAPITAQGTCPGGDADCSGDHENSDLPAMVSEIFGGSGSPCGCSDADGDGLLNAKDVSLLVTFIHDGM